MPATIERWIFRGVVLAVVTMAPLPIWALERPTDSGLLIAYVTLGLAGLVGVLGWAWWTYDVRKSQETLQSRPQPRPRPIVEQVERVASSRPNTGEFRLEPGSEAQIEVVLRASDVERERECPQCQRSFPPGLAVCPFDASPLREVAPTAPTDRGAGAIVSCVSCGRVYDRGPSHCYHDGKTLQTGRLLESGQIRVCRRCGFETEEALSSCPDDGEPLTKLTGADDEPVAPMLPLMTCRACGITASPGETVCPNDGEMLYPLTNVRLSTLPAQGVGPRRKVCTSCGRAYSRAANYCSHDGEKLISLN